MTERRDSAVPADPATLFVVGRGWHTDVALPAAEVAGPLAALRQEFPGVRYLVFGFGERRYLMDKHPGELLALLPGPGVMLVTALGASPAAAFGPEHVVALAISQDGLARENAFLWSYFAKDRNGRPLLLAAGPYSGSLFYASGGTYTLAHTCNTWTAEALSAGGLPVSGSGVLFAGQILRLARHVAASQARVPARIPTRLGWLGHAAAH